MLRLLGSESMIQSTIERLRPRIPLSRLAVVTNAFQAELIHQELHRQGWDEVRIWVEPEGRNTAAAVGLAAVPGEEPEDAVMAVFPADHFIRDRESLLAALDLGAGWARAGYLVTFGIPPAVRRPATATSRRGRPWRPGARFGEPSALSRNLPWSGPGRSWTPGAITGTAASLSAAGTSLLAAFARYPAGAPPGAQPAPCPKDRPSPGAEVYRRPAQHLPGPRHPGEGRQRGGDPGGDGLERRGHLGGPARHLSRDARGNVFLGRSLDRDSRDCLVYAQKRLVATIGLDNAIVVDTPDATLVCHRDRVQEVKDLVADLKRQNMVESVQHPTVERPWGRYTVMDEGPGYKVKQIEVDPGKQLSLQLHQHRAEHWVVVSAPPG